VTDFEEYSGATGFLSWTFTFNPVDPVEAWLHGNGDGIVGVTLLVYLGWVDDAPVPAGYDLAIDDISLY
jgi:hypothetical protein